MAAVAMENVDNVFVFFLSDLILCILLFFICMILFTTFKS
jgi:hypothetical protein